MHRKLGEVYAVSVNNAPDRNVVTGLAGRYATALFDLAREGGKIDETGAELLGFKGLIESSADLKLLITSPQIGRSDKASAVKAISEKAGFSVLTKNFLGTLAKNGRLSAFSHVADAFKILAAHHRGEVTADVKAAHALSDLQLDALKSKLRSAMGRDIAVNVTVDDTLLGGLIVKVGSKMIDSSLKTKLDRLEIAMKGAG